MVISEVLKVTPKIDESGLNKMEKALNTRFARVAKKFGGGLINVVKGAGLIGLAVGFIDKLLNPLKETQDAIERMISQGDDIVTNAQQFETTAGKLFKLTKFANAAGLENDGLFMLLTKYQTALAEAKADPSKKTAVSNFANDTDIAESFFGFIQALKTMEPSQRTLVQKEVFGEKQILKMADFLNQSFGELNTRMKLRPAEEYTGPLNKLGGLKDLDDELKSAREANDVFAKARIINEGMIRGKNASEALELSRENDRIAAYKNLKAISDTMNKIMQGIEQLTFAVGNILKLATPYIDQLIGYLKVIAGSRALKGIMGKGE